MARILEDWDGRLYSPFSISFDNYESLASLAQLQSLAPAQAPVLGHDVVALLYAAAAAFGALFVFQGARVVLVDTVAAVGKSVALFPAAHVIVARGGVVALEIVEAPPFGVVAFAGAQPDVSLARVLVFAADIIVVRGFAVHVASVPAAFVHVVVALVPNVMPTAFRFEPPWQLEVIFETNLNRLKHLAMAVVAGFL